ncbi:hypothetical protein GCM10023080_067000 [Streptomyces pseudoechinosporeus]
MARAVANAGLDGLMDGVAMRLASFDKQDSTRGHQGLGQSGNAPARRCPEATYREFLNSLARPGSGAEVVAQAESAGIGLPLRQTSAAVGSGREKRYTDRFAGRNN